MIFFVVVCLRIASNIYFLVQNILGEFNKEQEAFAKTQGNAGNAVSPWVGHANEERIKEEILSLSAVSIAYNVEKNKINGTLTTLRCMLM